MKEPSWSDFLNLASNQTDPFLSALRQIKALQHPKPQPYIFKALIAYAFIYLMLCTCCVLIICLPFLQGHEGQARRYWIVKRQYLGHSPKPFWIPNSGLVVAASHLIASIMFVLCLSLQYHALNVGEAGLLLQDYAWVEMRWFPGYFAFFVQAWSTWYIRASNSSSKGSKHVIHPLLFNSVLVFFPIAVLVIASVLTSLQSDGVRDQQNAFQTLIQYLSKASIQLSQGKNFTEIAQNESLITTYYSFVGCSKEASRRTRTTGLLWTFMGVPTFVFYVFGVASLIQKIRTCHHAVHQMIPFQQSETIDSDKPQKINSHNALSNGLENQESMSRQNRSSATYLACHYLSMAITLGYDVGLGFVYYLQEERDYVNPARQSVFVLLSLSASVLLLTSMLVQLVRIIVEGRETEVVLDTNLIKEGPLSSRRNQQPLELMT